MGWTGCPIAGRELSPRPEHFDPRCALLLETFRTGLQTPTGGNAPAGSSAPESGLNSLSRRKSAKCHKQSSAPFRPWCYFGIFFSCPTKALGRWLGYPLTN